MSNKKKILVIQKVHDKGMELINNHPDFDVEVTDDVSVENLKAKIKDCDGASIRIAKLPGEVINEASLITSPGSFAILIEAPSQSFILAFKFSTETSSVTSTSKSGWLLINSMPLS